MRRLILALLVAALAVTGCSSSEQAEEQVWTSKGAPSPGQGVFPVVASSEILVGDNRLQLGLVDDNDAQVRSPKTRLQVDFVGPGDQKPSMKTTMSLHGPSS